MSARAQIDRIGLGVKALGVKAFVAIIAAALLAEGAIAGARIGEIPPPHLGSDQHGERVNLEEMSGKVVVVTFWATWCGPCLKELPILEKIHAAVDAARLEVIAVNIEDRRTYRSARPVLKNYTMRLVNDHRGVVKRKYGVEGLPYLVIIGGDGRIFSIKQGYSEEQVVEIVDELNDLLRAQGAEVQRNSQGTPLSSDAGA